VSGIGAHVVPSDGVARHRDPGRVDQPSALPLRRQFVEHEGDVDHGIRPSARRRGLATWALGRMLDEARVFGLDRVLIVCEVDNIASAKTIERHGGVLEDVRDTELGAVRRYWIKI
jgi:predicted acetyltransferase